MFGIGTPELILILIVVLILFGGKKLPEFSRGLGEALREIRKGLAGDSNETQKDKKTKK